VKTLKQSLSTDMTHGQFLRLHGNSLSYTIKNVNLLSEQPEDKSGDDYVEPSFPLKLYFVDKNMDISKHKDLITDVRIHAIADHTANFTGGKWNYDVFCNTEKEEKIIWGDMTKTKLLYIEEPNKEEAHFFDNNVSTQKDGVSSDRGESDSACVLCFEPLHFSHYDYESRDGSDKYDIHDRLVHRCGHEVHAHCFLQACMRGHYRCCNCTLYSGKGLLLIEFHRIQREIMFYMFSIENEIEKTNEAITKLTSSKERPEDESQTISKEKKKLHEITRIKNVALDELDFLNTLLEHRKGSIPQEDDTTYRLAPSPFLEARLSSLNNLQRLSLALDRSIEGIGLPST
jgi:hypothetical protein